ncbi:calponin homology domain-containing protein DDB_G0272472-like isoform X2 [Saccostrea echinata]|uniref:calponin homology domain-containing protein DDB_G0272472-like isoform X2 n=1 Tax=Saccostrea echinata TaxID=191078 RepID=UPI002A80AF89|nr:calponin homology domain-containing protein DDB_G0272472-like isoform X2 [Saccostrea echinata]
MRDSYGRKGILKKFQRPVTSKVFSDQAKLGENLLNSKADDSKEQQLRELEEAVEKAEARATKELKAALKWLRNEKDEEKKRALQKQKEYYERLAARVEKQRDEAEEERIRELTKKLEREKEKALEEQWDECERIKKEAIEEACIALTKKLRNEFVLEKEKAIADALKIQKEKFLKREQESIERTRQECEEKARLEAERVARLHQQEIEKWNKRYLDMEKRYKQEKDRRRAVTSDFKELQDDYRRFMNYTDGKFHSDYMMHLRHLGMRLAEKRVSDVSSTVSYEDIFKLS